MGLTEEDWNQLHQWYLINGRHTLPWRKNRTTWSILLAEVLLRRTRADTVARVYQEIIFEFPDAATVLDNNDKFLHLTKGLGFSSRFNKFFSLCALLVDEYSNQVPVEYSILLSLPGIGHYSSDAIMCFGLGQSRYLVDTNTLRIASRLTGEDIDQQSHRSIKARVLVCKAFGPESKMVSDRNFALLDLAALICRSSMPLCTACPLSKACLYQGLSYDI